ncbi:metallophosphoesterase [candidate division KSB1 bacterium]|nr:metallophosphoesterase [candidate division KSB1 bacterium]
MSTIKTAIAVSDLHLGVPDSYLHSKDANYSKNMAAVRKLLQKLGPQDEFILNGDFLDLAVGSLDLVYADAKQFFKLLSESGPYKRIVFIPGNHDHHYWRALGEKACIDGRLSQDQLPPGHFEYSCRFVDARYSSKDSELPFRLLLSYAWPNETKMPEIVVKYPHHLVKVDLGNNTKAHYLVTHSHFLENRFKVADYVIESAHLEELEAFNNFWLETFNYYWGHAGRFSDKVRSIEEGYRKDEDEARRIVKEVLDGVYLNVVKKFNLCWPKTWLLKWILKLVVNNISLEDTTKLRGTAVDEKLKQAIQDYIDKYILKRYRKGNAEKYGFPSDSDIPTPFTFVFGHTHRPIHNEDLPDTKLDIDGKTFPLANTGGWLRSDSQTPRGEYAGVLLIDKKGVNWTSLEDQLA